MTNVLVTGAAGFIGSNLAKRCLDEGWSVTGVDDLSNGHREFVPAGTRLLIRDFSSARILREVRSQRYDVVFHLAAMPRVGYSVEHPLETHDVNVTRTLKLIGACRDNVRRFVFASSSSVYGDATVLPTPETHEKRPNSPYALQKSIIEDYLTMYCGLYDMDSVCMRFFNVFGPNQTPNGAYSMALSAWLSAIALGTTLRSDGDGTQTRDMCYVDNVTDALVRAARYDGLLSAQRFNVACGSSVSNNEVLQYLKRRYRFLVLMAPKRPGDVMHTLADVSSAKEWLGYVPLVDAWEGIDRTIRWFEGYYNKASLQ